MDGNKYIYNITFMVERVEERRLLQWLEGEALPLMVAPLGYQLVKVVAVPEDPEFEKQALSISLQVEFSGLGAARDWGKERLPALLDGFHKNIGHNALHFTTILRKL